METLSIFSILVIMPILIYSIFYFLKGAKQQRQFNAEMKKWCSQIDNKDHFEPTIPTQPLTTWEIYCKPLPAPKKPSFADSILDGLEKKWLESDGELEKFLKA